MSGLPEVTPTVGIKLASLAVHAEEAASSNGHEFDLQAIFLLLADPEVVDYMDELRNLALLPVPR